MSNVETESVEVGRTSRGKGATGTRKRLRSTVDHQRSEFLRRCRARIDPSEYGLPKSQRKRTEGLRREDVAALSGVSACWYSWLEQGRDMRVSDEVLERLSQTLKLSEDERVYLFSLVQRRPPRIIQEDTGPTAPPDVERMIQALTIPAVALNQRWDVLAWNRANSLIFRDYSAFPISERNLLTILFTRPVHHMNATQFEEMARRLVARVRFDYSKCADDPKFEALIRRLNLRSPLFNRLWRIPDFSLRAFGPHRFTHPRYGDVIFEHTSYVPDGHPNIRVVFCTPDNAAAKRAIAEVNGADAPRTSA